MTRIIWLILLALALVRLCSLLYVAPAPPAPSCCTCNPCVCESCDCCGIEKLPMPREDTSHPDWMCCDHLLSWDGYAVFRVRFSSDGTFEARCKSKCDSAVGWKGEWEIADGVLHYREWAEVSYGKDQPPSWILRFTPANNTWESKCGKHAMIPDPDRPRSVEIGPSGR